MIDLIKELLTLTFGEDEKPSFKNRKTADFRGFPSIGKIKPVDNPISRGV